MAVSTLHESDPSYTHAKEILDEIVDLTPKETNELYRDFHQRYPDEPRYAMDNAVNQAFITSEILVAAIEGAQSVDPTAVRDYMVTGGHEFSCFGTPCGFGGVETLGLSSPSQLSMWWGFSEVSNGVVEQLAVYEYAPMP